jgi:hypothetical protein
MLSAMSGFPSCRHAADDLHQRRATQLLICPGRKDRPPSQALTGLHHLHGLHHGGIDRLAHRRDFLHLKPTEIIEALPQQLPCRASAPALTEVCTYALQALKVALLPPSHA